LLNSILPSIALENDIEFISTLSKLRFAALKLGTKLLINPPMNFVFSDGCNVPLTNGALTVLLIVSEESKNQLLQRTSSKFEYLPKELVMYDVVRAQELTLPKSTFNTTDGIVAAKGLPSGAVPEVTQSCIICDKVVLPTLI
jgi:hypothetical protein